MEGKSNQKKKAMTLEDLSAQMASGFEQVDKRFKGVENLIEKKIEELGTWSQNEFLALGPRIDVISTDASTIKSNTEEIKANLNKKADRIELKELEIRVEKAEEKLGLKQKLKYT